MPRITLFIDTLAQAANYRRAVFLCEAWETYLYELGHYFGWDERHIADVGQARAVVPLLVSVARGASGLIGNQSELLDSLPFSVRLAPLLDSDRSQPDANPFSPAMPTDGPIVTEGKVVSVLPGTMFRVEVYRL